LTNTSTNSASEPFDWAPPWRVDRPARARPLPGPERDTWLEHRLLFRASRALKSLLDQIDPAIARNAPVAALNEDIVTVALLDFLDPPADDDAATSTSCRMPLHKARVFLDYFARGFRHYCQNHGLRPPRLPMLREFSLEQGTLSADTFESLRDYRRYVCSLIKEIERFLVTPSGQLFPPEEVTAVVLCSSALFGGLVRKDHWAALAKALSRPLEKTGHLFCFRFDLPRPYRWIADPVTEALLRRFCERKILPLATGTTKVSRPIARALGIESTGESALSHLTRAVKAAHARYFAPDVASIAQGLIPNTPLAEEPWLRLMSGTRHPATRAKISLSIPRIVPTAQPDTVQHVAIAEIIGRISAAVRWNPVAKRKLGNQESNKEQSAKKFVTDAKTALRVCEGDLAHLYARAGHSEGHLRTFAYGLLCYARDLLELGGVKLSVLSPGTIDDYVAIIHNHMSQLHFQDLVELDTESRADAYRESIRRQQVSIRTSHRTAFEGFERSILRHMDITDEVDWATIPGRARHADLPPADANLIDPVLYRHLFELLEAPARDTPIVELARALLVILYRFGLRTGEAAEVTTGALVLHRGECASLRVSRSELTTRKSTNARRLVGPIPLPPDEFAFLAAYREQRAGEAARRGRDRAATYLFSTDGTSKLEHIEPAQRLLIDVLREAAGDPNLRARHFRHTFVSRLHLAGRNDLNPLEPVSPDAAGDEWWRTFATGHASPETGIISYTHTNEIAHYHYACGLVSAEAPLPFLSRLAGNDARSLERARLRALNESPVSGIFLQSVRKNSPCAELPTAEAKRIAYPPISVRREPEAIDGVDHRLAWDRAWAIYATARVGKTPSDMDEHAGIIRARVNELEMRERLMLRNRRRPQLEAQERAAAAVLWQALPDDNDLRLLITAAVDCLRPWSREVLMPAETARALELRLKGAGLTTMQSREGTSQRRWLWRPEKNEEFSTLWMELLAFLYCGAG